ncbi:kinase-like protein [Sistotremastrum niveocremeum HHB9708]|uniref:non-specific serine/threonine protein kinase n=1 Tax=Sistotremastrum niveocremeum HHB9708 TaxID=1314777 RepID=A0A164QNQ4_9AGAM|nr:kinase-like protein [Sistotremastrum niveocremeum HHB9708]
MAGLEFMHSRDNPVYHGDLKGNNVLIFGTLEAPVAKLTDFGLSKICAPMPTAATRVGGNTFWTAPEIVQNKVQRSLWGGPPPKDSKLTWEADVWGFGATAFELITQWRFPFKDMNESRLEHLLCCPSDIIDNEIADYLACVPHAVRSILHSCLSADPAGRSTIFDLRKQWNEIVTPEFQSQDWKSLMDEVEAPQRFYHCFRKEPGRSFEDWRTWMESRRDNGIGRVQRPLSTSDSDSESSC